MKRFVFDNLVYKLNEESFAIMNLISFRRETITKDALDKLILIEGRLDAGKDLSGEEESFLEQFHEKKQILPPEIMEEVDRQLEKESELHLSKFPVRGVTFNITHNCNFRCDYCYQRKYKDKPEYGLNMSVEDIVSFMEYLKLPYFDDTGFEEIVVSGGESLLPSNIDVINYICKHVPAEKKVLFTNGINILQYKDKVLFEAFDEVQLSLDGPDAVIRQVNHCGEAFNKIIDGIRYLQQMNKRIRIVTMWTKELRSHITEYIELLKESRILEHPGTTIKFVLARDYYTKSSIDRAFYTWDEIVADLKRYRPLFREINSYLEISPEIGRLGELLHRPVNERRNLKYNVCDITKSIPMVLEPNGDIYWCLCLDGEAGKIGNYRDKSFDWDKVEKMGSRTIYKVEQCRQCRLRYLCGGGCILPLTSGGGEVYQPVCEPWNDPFVWENLEKIV